MNPQQKKQAQFSGAYALVALVLLLLALGLVARRAASKPIPMSDLVSLVKDGKLAEAQVRARVATLPRPASGRSASRCNCRRRTATW